MTNEPLDDVYWPDDHCPQCEAPFVMLGYEAKCPTCGMIFYLNQEGDIVDADPSDYVDPWADDGPAGREEGDDE